MSNRYVIVKPLTLVSSFANILQEMCTTMHLRKCVCVCVCVCVCKQIKKLMFTSERFFDDLYLYFGNM